MNSNQFLPHQSSRISFAFRLLEVDFEFSGGLFHLIGQGWRLGGGWRSDGAIESIAQGAFDELAAVNFHRRQGS
jgi:hypothetical protein